MNLLVVSWWMPYPPDNGTRLRAFNLLTHLARRHRITLLTFGEPRDPADVAALEACCARVAVVPPGQLTRGTLSVRGLLSPIPRYYVQTHSPAMAAQVAAHLPGQDAVLGLTYAAALYLTHVTGQIPSVLDEFEVSVPREQYLRERHPLKRVRHGLTWWKFQRFIRWMADRFDRSTVVSELERSYLQEMGCDTRRVAVIPNGVNLPPEPAGGARARQIIYPGSVQYSANLDAVRYFVHDVLPIVRRTAPDLTLLVTGATDGVDIGDLAGVSGVRFTGRVPDVDPLIRDSLACVVPLRIGGGTRLKILHAMALGTPVVSTTKGIEGLDIEPDRHVLVADAPQAIADQILRLAGGDPVGARLSRDGRTLVQDRYAWGPIAAHLDEVIAEAVEDHRAGRRPRT